jgi:hypothetical protein
MDLFDVVVSSGTIPRLKDVCNAAIIESESGIRELSPTMGEVRTVIFLGIEEVMVADGVSRA